MIMEKNKGYTLIEMIIVIAIMAILSGLAVVSLNLISKARARDAVQTFNSQLSNLWLRTKSTAATQKSMRAVLENCHEADEDDRNYVFTISDSTVNDAGATIWQDEDTTTLKKWDKYITIEYTASPTGQMPTENATGKWIIQFDKATGAVVKGAGTYAFKDKSGSVIATVHLDAVTGNHYIK